MATIDSLANGIRLLELIAKEGAPMPTPLLIERCSTIGMSSATTRNVVETLSGMGWLSKVQGPGATALYGLGGKAARLWQTYVGQQITDLKEKNNDLTRRIQTLEHTIELGGETE